MQSMIQFQKQEWPQRETFCLPHGKEAAAVHYASLGFFFQAF